MSDTVQGTGYTMVGETCVVDFLYYNQSNLNTFLAVGE